MKKSTKLLIIISIAIVVVFGIIIYMMNTPAMSIEEQRALKIKVENSQEYKNYKDALKEDQEIDNIVNYVYKPVDNISAEDGSIVGTKYKVIIDNDDLDILSQENIENIINKLKNDYSNMTIHLGDTGYGIIFIGSGSLVIYGQVDENGNLKGDILYAGTFENGKMVDLRN